MIYPNYKFDFGGEKIMENNKASMTAMVSCFGRAYHSLYDDPKIFDDFLARKFLTDEEFNQMSGFMAKGIQFFNPEHGGKFTDIKEALKWVIQNQIAPTPLARARYCEDMLRNAVELGVRQYVLLGAGMDTFAFRNKEMLEQLDVFEIDHPATQELKKTKIKILELEIPKKLHFVPVDFRTDDFVDKMLATHYDKTGRTFFSWLGVTYYLSKENILQMLKAIVSISAKGSAIVFDYGDEDFFDKEKSSKRVQNTVGMAAGAGEHMKSCFSYRELEELLEESGLLIYEHLDSQEINQKYFQNRGDYYHAFENTNYVLAVIR